MQRLPLPQPLLSPRALCSPLGFVLRPLLLFLRLSWLARVLFLLCLRPSL